MPKRSDPVEALAKVLRVEYFRWIREEWQKSDLHKCMARAAIAHLSKKRGAKRG